MMGAEAEKKICDNDGDDGVGDGDGVNDDISLCFPATGLNISCGSVCHLILTAGWGGAPVIVLSVYR